MEDVIDLFITDEKKIRVKRPVPIILYSLELLLVHKQLTN